MEQPNWTNNHIKYIHSLTHEHPIQRIYIINTMMECGTFVFFFFDEYYEEQTKSIHSFRLNCVLFECQRSKCVEKFTEINKGGVRCYHCYVNFIMMRRIEPIFFCHFQIELKWQKSLTYIELFLLLLYIFFYDYH